MENCRKISKKYNILEEKVKNWEKSGKFLKKSGKKLSVLAWVSSSLKFEGEILRKYSNFSSWILMEFSWEIIESTVWVTTWIAIGTTFHFILTQLCQLRWTYWRNTTHQSAINWILSSIFMLIRVLLELLSLGMLMKMCELNVKILVGTVLPLESMPVWAT